MSLTKNVLLAILDAELHENLKNRFAASGYQVFSTSDGGHASHLARNESFACIVAEMKLKGMSGQQMLSIARANRNNAKTLLFLIGPGNDDGGAKLAAQIGNVKYLAKPVDTQALVKTALETINVAAKPRSYDVRILNCFLDATMEVFEFYFSVKPEMGKPTIKADRKATGYASGLIGFTGNGFQGSLSITAKKALTNALVHKMLPEVPSTIDDMMIADLIGELANQICGKVKINLSKIGVKVMIGLPKVVLGENHSIIHQVHNPVVSLPIKIVNDECSVEFCMGDGAEQEINEEEGAAAPSSVSFF